MLVCRRCLLRLYSSGGEHHPLVWSSLAHCCWLSSKRWVRPLMTLALSSCSSSLWCSRCFNCSLNLWATSIWKQQMENLSSKPASYSNYFCGKFIDLVQMKQTTKPAHWELDWSSLRSAAASTAQQRAAPSWRRGLDHAARAFWTACRSDKAPPPAASCCPLQPRPPSASSCSAGQNSHLQVNLQWIFEKIFWQTSKYLCNHLKQLVTSNWACFANYLLIYFKKKLKGLSKQDIWHTSWSLSVRTFMCLSMEFILLCIWTSLCFASSISRFESFRLDIRASFSSGHDTKKWREVVESSHSWMTALITVTRGHCCKVSENPHKPVHFGVSV